MTAAGAFGLSGLAESAPSTEEVTPEQFGAKGDGRTNDTEAFAAMSAHVRARSGGTIVLRPVTYIVGAQRRVSGRKDISFAPSEIIHLANCKLPLTIKGHGAKLQCAAGLRYGRFDADSGRALPPPANTTNLTSQAIPYDSMIHIETCSGPITISDIELDGNLPGLRIGGPYGTGGWQAGGTGIRLDVNSGPERLQRIRSYHHPQDGLMLTAPVDRKLATHVSDVTCSENGRQGCSITGGRNFAFERCKFERTGRLVLHSAPTAGVDIEAELPLIRNVSFFDCEFSDNHGFGLVAGSGDSAGIRFERCRFIGTSNWSAWPDRPEMHFANCLFVGSINHCHGDRDPARAAQFLSCTFTDDPALSPTGKVFLIGGNYIAVVLDSPNVRFTKCRFRLVGKGVLPLSHNHVIYADCRLSQRSASPSGPRGTFLGTNVIEGNAHLEDSIIRGRVILNGRLLPVSG